MFSFKCVTALFPKLPNQEPKDLPDWIILDIWALLSFISVDIFLAKAFLILVICFGVRNNSCDNSSSLKFFLFSLNIVRASFFAADYNLFNCAFVNLTLSLLDCLPLFILHFLVNILILFLWFFSKIVKINIDSTVLLLPGFSNCPTNSICWIAFGSASNSFCLFKSTAINLYWILI